MHITIINIIIVQIHILVIMLHTITAETYVIDYTDKRHNIVFKDAIHDTIIIKMHVMMLLL